MLQVFKTLPSATRNSFDAVCGHIHMNWHHHISRPCLYTTVLRDPLERVISDFYFYHVARGKYNTDGQSPAQTLKIHLTEQATEPKNKMLRQFLHQAKYLTFAQTKEDWSPSQTAEMLELGKETLRNSFALVGITERLDDFLFLLQRRMGWPLRHYKNEKRNRLFLQRIFLRKHLYRKYIDAEQAASFREQNSADYAIYSYARHLFEQQWADLSRIEKYRCYRYRAVQRFYDPIKLLYDKTFSLIRKV